MTTENPEQTQATVLGVDAEFGEDVSDMRQFVIFVAGNEVFAVDMAPVQEIIRMPAVIRVPMAPSSLDGLANLRGKVLPIINLRRIFGFEECPYDDSTRAIVIDQGQSLGFVVDRVASVVGIDAHQIEDTCTISTTINTDLVSGIIKNVDGYPMIMVLDFGKLIANEFAEHSVITESVANSTLESKQPGIDDESEITDELQLVSFAVANQEYAITIDDVQEIVQVPDQVVYVPHSKSHVLGVITLRNRMLPLVSLRRMFALPCLDADDKSRIVVVSLGSESVGVVVDSVHEVLHVARTEVDAMPGLLAKDGDLSDISEICRLDSGKRLVSILSVKNMFGHSEIRAALTELEKMNVNGEREEKDPDNDAINDEEQVVVFRLGKEEFGVSIESVQEIVRISDELTHVPKAPPAVEGVMNLRGLVLPVIDLRRRLGLEQVMRSDMQRIVVFLIGGVRTGFIVDSVSEVLKIHRSTIEPAPQLSGQQSMLLARMANLEKQKRMIQLIEPSYLMGNQDLESLSQLVA